MKRLILGRQRCETIRTIARQAYLDANGDTNKAIALVKERLKGIIASILIGLAIKLAWELIKHWFLNKIRVPALTFVPGEPGYAA